jgi:ribosomal protein L10
LKLALAENGCEDVGDESLEGHTAIIVADEGRSGVAKTGVKSGALSKHPRAASKIRAISELPFLEVLRPQVLALFNTPAQQLLRVCNAVSQDVVNVSQARVGEMQCLKKLANITRDKKNGEDCR